MTDAKDFVNDIKSKFHNGFGINRIPPTTKEQFFKLTNEEFCSDRGLCLKFLVDFYFGLIPSGVEHLEMAIKNLEAELDDIKEQLKSKETEKKPVKMMNGKTIK